MIVTVLNWKRFLNNVSAMKWDLFPNLVALVENAV